MLIGGKWVPAASGATLDVINPSTAQVFATIAGGGAAEIDAAVRAARRAFSSGPWAKLRAVKRAKLLYRLADAVEANADDIAWLESLASLANDTQYGLAAKIWTRDLRSAHQLARKLQAGWITINGGREGALSFTEIKSISVGY